MKYWRVFQESWQILWQHKILWAFGLLAALGGGGFNFNWRIGDLQPVIDLPLGARALLNDFFRQVDPTEVVIAGVVLGSLMFGLLTFAGGGLIGLVIALRRREPISLRLGLKAANTNFLPLLVCPSRPGAAVVDRQRAGRSLDLASFFCRIHRADRRAVVQPRYDR